MKWFGRNGRGRRGDPIIGNTSSSGGGGDNNYGRRNNGNDGMVQSSTHYPPTATTNPSRHSSSNSNNNSGSNMFGMIRNSTGGRGRDPSMSQDLLRQEQQDINVYGGPIVDGLVRCLARILPCSESLIGRLLWVCVWGWKVAPVALYETFLRRPNRNTDSSGRSNDNNNIDVGTSNNNYNNNMNEKGLGFRQYIDTWWKKTFVVPTTFGFYYFLYDYIAQPMVYSVGCCQSDIVTYLAEMSVLAVHFVSGVTMHLCEERNRQRKQRQTDFEMQYQHEMDHGLGGNATTNNPSDGIMKNGYHNSTSSPPSSSNNQLHDPNEHYRTGGRQQGQQQQQQKPRRIWSLFGGRRGSRRKDNNINFDNNDNNVTDGSQYPSTTL